MLPLPPMQLQSKRMPPAVLASASGPGAARDAAEQAAALPSGQVARHESDAAFGHALSAKPGRKKRKRRAKRARYSWVALERRHPGAFVTHGPAHVKVAALTFDDAPDPRFTPQILEILARHRVRATFFIVGSRARAHPELVRRIVREGHLIGNHSDTHALLTRLTPAGFEREIRRADRTLLAIAGRKPRFIRPPYGEISPKQTDWTARRGYIVANWNVDAVDWRNTPSRTIIANVRKQIRPGAIILLHAGGGRGQDLSGTVNALPRLIAMLKRQGYRLLTLDELLGQRGYRT
jgi:Predicted xylanase/chitin deacetylase